MADARQRTTLGNVFRFVVRTLGLTGVVAAAVGAVLLSTELPAPAIPSDGSIWVRTQATVTDGWATLYSCLQGERTPFLKLASWVFAGGVIAVGVWLVIELLSAMVLVTGRRTAVGANAYLQITLAIALLVLVNMYSFSHYKRFDLTKDKQFTLPKAVKDDVEKVVGSTDIIVLQLHKTAGGLDKPDALDFAAERKVIEKIRDLVDQFRELGPRFRVRVLDVEEEGYETQVAELTKDAPELKAAIDSAPENSILFRSGQSVQRMSFSDFYLLDKTASKSSDGKSVSNLVLIPQGVDRVARRITDLDAKKPKVGLLTIHPVLSTQGTIDWGAGGLRKSLEANGFDVKDVMVKRWDIGNGTPASNTVEEYELDDLQGTYLALKEEVLEWETNAAMVSGTIEKLKSTPLPARVEMADAIIRLENDADRTKIIARLDRLIEQAKEERASREKQLAEVGPKYFAAMKNEKAMEGRKASDLKSKFAADVADCDILVIPRLTSYDVGKGGILAPSYFPLGKEHADVVQSFLTNNKPVMLAFGPIEFGLPPGRGEGDTTPDDVELLFSRLGIDFGKQTVLTDAEGQTAARQQRDRLGSTEPLPPLLLSTAKQKTNPIAAAVALSGKAAGRTMELRVSGPRPVYLNPSVAAKLPYSGELLGTVKESWNEARPLRLGGTRPKYEATKEDDPKRGTRDEERSGPFAVGVAIEVPVPAEWKNPKLLAPQTAMLAGAFAVSPFAGAAAATLDPAAFAKTKDAPTVRVSAIGHGGLFTGKQLDAAQEKLLLHSLNWQLRREDYLPQEKPSSETWRFPRVSLSDRDATLWRWGTFVGLPVLAGYFVLLMLMLRKVR
jgi:hypothetical protein